MSMSRRNCFCGAEAGARCQTRRTEDGREKDFYCVLCPVCGQGGPVVPAEGKDEETAIAEAVLAWNNMYAQIHSA
jgi:hypothetical protein